MEAKEMTPGQEEAAEEIRCHVWEYTDFEVNGNFITCKTEKNVGHLAPEALADHGIGVKGISLRDGSITFLIGGKKDDKFPDREDGPVWGTKIKPTFQGGAEITKKIQDTCSYHCEYVLVSKYAAHVTLNALYPEHIREMQESGLVLKNIRSLGDFRLVAEFGWE